MQRKTEQSFPSGGQPIEVYHFVDMMLLKLSLLMSPEATRCGMVLRRSACCFRLLSYAFLPYDMALVALGSWSSSSDA